MKDIKHIRQDFHSIVWVMPQGWDYGVLGGQNFNFLNIVTWHIKLKGMISRPGYTEKFYPRNKLVTFGRGQQVKYHYISSRALGLAIARHGMCSSCFLDYP